MVRKGKIISKTITTIDKIKSLSNVLSQRQIAKKLGVNQSTVSRLISGKIKNTKKLTTRNKRTITNSFQYYNKNRAVGYNVTFFNEKGKQETRSTFTTRLDSIQEELARFIDAGVTDNDLGSGTLFDTHKGIKQKVDSKITHVKIDRKVYNKKGNKFNFKKTVQGKKVKFK